MKSKSGSIPSSAVTIICILSFFLIFIRIFAKEVLIDSLDIRNEKVSFVANYYWGDQLADHPPENLDHGYSEDYAELRKIYEEAILAAGDEAEDSDTSEIAAKSKTAMLLAKYEAKVEGLKSDINRYCNFHFILRPYLTELKLSFMDLLGWDMAYARKNGDEYMLDNGVVEKAETKNEGPMEPDLTVKNAADKYGANYIYMQYPYRINTDDTYVPYGADNYYNENADRYLDALRAEGVEVLDLRKELKEAGWDNHEGYYLNDSHWKTDSGFLAADLISRYFSENYDGFVYNSQYHDPSSYRIKTVDLNNPMIWESVNLYLPKFNTSFHFISMEDDPEGDKELAGDLESTLFDMTKAEEGRFSHVLSAYSVSNIGISVFEEINNEMDSDHHGTILYISNSFSWHIIPYLAMDCDKVYFLHIDERNHAEGIIEKVHPDIVIEAPF